MKISKTMIKEIDVANMDAVEVLSEIGSAVGTMRTHCHGLDYVELIKVEAFKEQQNPHIRIVVKVGTKRQEEGKE